MMKKPLLLIVLLSVLHILSFAQDTTKLVAPEVSLLSISGYVEAYYSYDLGQPANHERPGFVYSYSKHNEVNLNLGYIKASYNASAVRANFALMAGTYPQYNLAGEQGLLKNVFEANAGIKLSKSYNLWLDAGVMPSHIGFESAIGKDCWTLTRSILADNSPYYEAGVKLGYTSASEKWYAAAMYLNGWQRIQRLPASQTPSFGTQVTYKPGTNTTLNWSTYAGNEKPDSVAQWRYFNNFYAIVQVTPKLGLTGGFDIGFEQMAKGSSKYNMWYAPLLKVQYKFTDTWRATVRGEYYSDANGVIMATGTPNGFMTSGLSMNFDYLPAKNIMLRFEGRTFQSKDKIFMLHNKASSQNYFFTTSLAVSF